MARAVATGVLAAVAAGALLAGPGTFGAAVTAIATVLVFDLSGVLARAGARPVVLAALVTAAALPAAVAFRPGIGWESVPVFFTAGFALAFVLVLVFGRRAGVTAGAGATVTVSTLIGLGSTSLLLLHALPDGFRWVIGLGVLAAAADVGAPLGHRMLRRGMATGDAPAGARRLAGAAAAVLVAAVAVGAVLDPPFTWWMAALFAGIALVAAAGVEDLARALAAEAGIGPRPRRLIGRGLLVRPAGTLLVGAPAAYVLARAVAA